MELTQQIAALEDEVKLVKGEIKNILKELRTALLNQDNPFVLGAAPPTFRPVGRAGATSSEPDADEPPPVAERAAPEAGADVPKEAPPQGPAPVSPDPVPFAAATPPASAPAVESPSVVRVEPRWSALTIASLAAWVEDSIATLGTRRFQLLLELAGLAGLVPQETREVLAKLHELGPTKEAAADRPLHINECLVVLRQLEAILQGEKVTALPRRRAGRHSRVR